jgi:hypothetical protein
MRWRFVDRITAFEPWARIAGRKAASLEEYSLLERFGRPVEIPETLILESAVQLAAWLVVKSSGGLQTALLDEVSGLRFAGRVGAGGVIETVARVERRDVDRLAVAWESRRDGRPVCDGRMTLALVPFPALCDPERIDPLWRELYAPA